MLPAGLYDRPLDLELADMLAAHPELQPTFSKLDDEALPHAYSQFVHQILRQVLASHKPPNRSALINRLLTLLAADDGMDYVARRQLLDGTRQLRQLQTAHHASPFIEPNTSLSVSSLLTGAADDPALERELRAEMMTADRVDILVAFIKWSGLQLLLPAFDDLAARGVPVRIITTSYMGASDPKAVEWLAAKPGFHVRVSYDTERTRLHAKAYHFVRRSGYSTAYIGSANMTRPAMTSGLEWTVKVTAQDMPHILDRFAAEFETYWARDEFSVFDPQQPERFREAINRATNATQQSGPRFFADITPHPFQERILEALVAARAAGSHRNLVVAATGTGKTVIAAFDFARHLRAHHGQCRLLFTAHRKEILQQARDCFRSVLRDFNFGELLVDGERPTAWQHVFASIQSLNTHRPWERLGAQHFPFVIVDEAHRGTAASYRPVLDTLQPQILLGLTATPERMDKSSILPDFDNQFAAEIRLPEALEEKLLCPFHYFGVSDPVSLADESFWRNGRYASDQLEAVYTGDDMRARDRLNAILAAIDQYMPVSPATRAVGFCAGVKHAEFMANRLRAVGLAAEVVLGDTPSPIREQRVRDFRRGTINFLFTVDVFSEGVDIPEINLVLFLRPTESLTVFLQQLGRGLRHAPEKDCLTVLDFVGQAHRKYRLDHKFSALLRRQRRRIDEEIERDFPNLPPGCNIHLERVAREHVLNNIRQSLGNLRAFIPEVIRTFEAETQRPLTFANFIAETKLSPLTVLRNRTWSEWKDLAAGTETVRDPDIADARLALRRIALRSDPSFLRKVAHLSRAAVAEAPAAYKLSDAEADALHFVLWSKSGPELGVDSHRASFDRWLRNPHSAADMAEIIDWRLSIHDVPTSPIQLGFPCFLQLHADYGYREINAAFGKTTLASSGPKREGVVLVESIKTYLHFVTFRKEDKDFAPSTRYQDYPISPRLLHWESQATTTQASPTGHNYRQFRERGYSILFFARLDKKIDGQTAPFAFLGPAQSLVSCEGDRPIKMVWELQNPIPAALFEEARAV
jgi:superfamily II DNA or RNA helicase/HKD family nuclease